MRMRTTLCLIFFLACNFYCSYIEEQHFDRYCQVQTLTLDQVIDTCAAYYGIPKQVILGVGTSETGMGIEGVGKKANNLFGVMDGKYDSWKGDHYKSCDTCNRWRKYATPQESVPDFCKFVLLHYPKLIGKPIDKWLLWGYGNSKYERKGFFKQFEGK